jgi:hypothetical protein
LKTWEKGCIFRASSLSLIFEAFILSKHLWISAFERFIWSRSAFALCETKLLRGFGLAFTGRGYRALAGLGLSVSTISMLKTDESLL